MWLRLGGFYNGFVIAVPQNRIPFLVANPILRDLPTAKILPWKSLFSINLALFSLVAQQICTFLRAA